MDYDVDKAYLMGLEIGEDGKLIGYSNLFDYSTPLTLRESLRLPMPLNYTILVDSEFQNNKNIDSYITLIQNINEKISLYTNNLKKIYDRELDKDKQLKLTRSIYQSINYYKALRIHVLSQLITELYNLADRTDLTVRIGYNKDNEETVNYILKLIGIHQATKTSPFLTTRAYRNFVSNSIQNTVLDLVNMVAAYNPITMEDLHVKDGNINDAMLMNQLNPLMKYEMQIQNMVGKKVIGIMAVGEKVFYNLNYYMNEKLRRGDTDYVHFSRSYSLILDRYKSLQLKDTSLIRTAEKHMLSDVNLDGVDENIVLRFLSSEEALEEIRKENPGISEDSEEFIGKLSDRIKEKLKSYGIGTNAKVDNMISELLSAATDNAKELILYLINCDENMAKCYIHLLCMGFDIKDVITYMTSPAVGTVKHFSQSSIYDVYTNSLFENDIINWAMGFLPLLNFLKTIIYTEDGTISMADNINNTIPNDFIKKLFTEDEIKAGIKLLDVILRYIQKKITGDIDLDISEVLPNLRYLEVKALLSEINRTVDIINKAVNQYMQDYNIQSKQEAWEFYQKDMMFYRQVIEGGKELSSLGNVMLGLNQGIPSSKEDLMKKIRNIAKIVTDREKAIGINKKNLSSKKTIDEVVETICSQNKFLDPEKVLDLLHVAYDLGLVELIDFDKWIMDPVVTLNDRVVEELSPETLEYLNSHPDITYKQLVKEYYDIIKYAINPFDVIDIVPLFRAITGLFKAVYTFDKELTIRGSIINIIYQDLLRKTNFIDLKMERVVSGYVRDLLITSFFNNTHYNFLVLSDTEMLDNSFGTIKYNTELVIPLNIPQARASFNKVFLDMIIGLQQGSDYSLIYNPNKIDLKNNYFISHLKINTDKYGVPYLVSDIDLLNIKDNPVIELEFLKMIDGLDELSLVYINDMSLYDWFAAYNIYVNLNQYGSERLTTFFKNYSKQSKILNDLYRYIENLDYNIKDAEALTKTLGYNIDDLYIRNAPLINKRLEHLHKEPYIKVLDDNGVLQIKKKGKNGYHVVDIFPTDQVVGSRLNISFNLRYNYSMYQSIKLTYQDNLINVLSLLGSNDANIIRVQLIAMMKKNILNITTVNC